MGPWLAEGSAGNRLLHCDRQHVPPTCSVTPWSIQVSYILLPIVVHRHWSALRPRCQARRASAVLRLGAPGKWPAALRRFAVRRAASSTSAVQGGTPGAVVCTSHCCGTTCLSAPTASPATRTHAHSTTLARQRAGLFAGKRARGHRVGRLVPHSRVSVRVCRRRSGAACEGGARVLLLVRRVWR